MKAITTDAIISSFRRKVDGSLSLTVHTPELSPAESAEFMLLQGANLKALFEPHDMPHVPPLKIDREIERKTPSQRLRGVLYLIWESEGSQGDFNDYYKSEYDKIINHYKGKLD